MSLFVAFVDLNETSVASPQQTCCPNEGRGECYLASMSLKTTSEGQPCLYLGPLHLFEITASRCDVLKSAASIVDAIGRRACSGATLRLPFGEIGMLLMKGRTIRFEFAEGFRRPRMDSRAVEASGADCVP